MAEAGTVFRNHFHFDGHTAENKDEISRLQIYYGRACEDFHNGGSPRATGRRNDEIQAGTSADDSANPRRPNPVVPGRAR